MLYHAKVMQHGVVVLVWVSLPTVAVYSLISNVMLDSCGSVNMVTNMPDPSEQAANHSKSVPKPKINIDITLIMLVAAKRSEILYFSRNLYC